jgi:hypothetical protein
VQRKQLLFESEVLENEILAGAEKANDPADEVPRNGIIARNLIAPPWHCSAPKSFISCMREILMTDNKIPPFQHELSRHELAVVVADGDGRAATR